MKDNQPKLREAIERFFEPEVETPGFGRAITDLHVVSPANQGHGRLERRTLAVCGIQDGELDLPFARQVFRLHRRFVYRKSGKVVEETVFGITRLPREKADAARLIEINLVLGLIARLGIRYVPEARRKFSAHLRRPFC